jgi:hypothetical protein
MKFFTCVQQNVRSKTVAAVAAETRLDWPVSRQGIGKAFAEAGPKSVA